MKDTFRCLEGYVASGQFCRKRNLPFPWEKSLMSVGSILGRGTKRTVVWGSGFMNEDESFQGGYICAVRGKYTRAKLQEQGFECPDVFGDPALLLPLIIESDMPRKGLGIVPHWRETDDFISDYGGRYKVINLVTTDLERVVLQMTSCKRILSTSLHGIIIAHAYGIPAIWIKKGYIDTDGFKFRDYFSSVDIPIYDGFTDIDDILKDENTIRNFFACHTELSLPHKSLPEIQKSLLQSAPFELLPTYRCMG